VGYRGRAGRYNLGGALHNIGFKTFYAAKRSRAMSEESPPPDHDPRFWLKQAMELDRAAMLLWDAIRADFEKAKQLNVGSELTSREAPFMNLGGVFWLNAGFALENSFKGLILQSQPSLISNGVLNKKLRTHDLLKLAEIANVELNGVEGFYLWIATKCVQWSGRYPVALSPGETVPLIFSEADVMTYKAVLGRILKLFDPKYSTIKRFKRVV
jgi:hypothetical protein